MTAQQRMDAAFENYLELSTILSSDLITILDSEVDDQHWRRNFIRVSSSLLEGYAHCLREMCAISLECEAPKISKEEIEVLKSERAFDANTRIKLTLRAAYKLFELSPAPSFGDREWPRAQDILGKRHLLMHPKNVSDLEITDQLWAELYAGVLWLLRQFFSFLELLQQKHDRT